MQQINPFFNTVANRLNDKIQGVQIIGINHVLYNVCIVKIFVNGATVGPPVDPPVGAPVDPTVDAKVGPKVGATVDATVRLIVGSTVASFAPPVDQPFD